MQHLKLDDAHVIKSSRPPLSYAPARISLPCINPSFCLCRVGGHMDKLKPAPVKALALLLLLIQIRHDLPTTQLIHTSFLLLQLHSLKAHQTRYFLAPNHYHVVNPLDLCQERNGARSVGQVSLRAADVVHSQRLMRLSAALLVRTLYYLR